MNNVFTVSFLIAITALGITIFWRTCIYTRGAIFRPIGRILDLWVIKGCSPRATFFDKLLRFLAYPLGRCVYCSGFHFTYEVFFIVNYFFLGNNLGLKWLFFIIPFNHLLLIIYMKYFISNNEDMAMGDWEYMKYDKFRIWDFPKRRLNTVLSPEEERVLEECKNGKPNG